MNPVPTDRELWNSLKKGDRTALEQIYRQQIDYLLQYGLKFASDTALIEDSIHDLFVDIWRRRQQLGETDSIRAYLLVSLRRSLIKRIKRQQKYNTGKEPEELDFQADLAIDQILINAEITHEQAQRLREAMVQLSSRQREALYLRYYQDLDYEAICEMMDINYQSVRNLVSGAIRTLREQLGIFFFLYFLELLLSTKA